MEKKSIYRLTVETDYRLIKGESISSGEKAAIAAELLSAAAPTEAVTPAGRQALYPLFYIPPQQVKLRSLMGQTPKTKIFSGNMYELEILRLLCLLAPSNPQVMLMRDATLRRLKTTCFGWEDDGVGECFDTSLIVLRFLCAASPEDTEWIRSRIENYNRHANEKKRPWFPLWYFWLCLSEMPMELALPEIAQHRVALEKKLRRSYVMHSEQDRALHPMLVCMLRNLMSRLPEYSWLAGCEPCVGGADGRVGLPLHFAVRPA